MNFATLYSFDHTTYWGIVLAMENQFNSTLWIDNDACPKRIRDVILKAILQINIPSVFVSNQFMHLPHSDCIKSICVNSNFDAADDYIAENVKANDLVITADIPLADRVVSQQAIVISPRGEVLDKETIKERLTIRNLNQEFRSVSDVPSGPRAINDKDIKRFASCYDRWVTKLWRSKINKSN